MGFITKIKGLNLARLSINPVGGGKMGGGVLGFVLERASAIVI